MVLLGELVAREVFEFVKRHTVESCSDKGGQEYSGTVLGAGDRRVAHALELRVAEVGEVYSGGASGASDCFYSRQVNPFVVGKIGKEQRVNALR